MRVKRLEELRQIELTLAMGRQTINVSVYYIDNLLIDSGPKRRSDTLIPLFKKWKIEQAIFTHHHEDHTGLGRWLQTKKKIPIYMHKKGVALCQKKLSLPFYRRVFWGKREPFQAEPITQVFKTGNFTWDIIHSPGHADDHISLYNREKGWLFGGDLYVNPRPKSMYAFESMPKMIQSIQKILQFDFTHFICSHTGVLNDGRKKLTSKLNYLLQLEGEIVQLYKQGKTPKEIRKILLPRRHIMHYISGFENSPMHLIHSVIERDRQLL